MPSIPASTASFLEDKLYLDFDSHYLSAVARLTAQFQSLDLQRVAEHLAQDPE